VLDQSARNNICPLLTLCIILIILEGLGTPQDLMRRIVMLYVMVVTDTGNFQTEKNTGTLKLNNSVRMGFMILEEDQKALPRKTRF